MKVLAQEKNSCDTLQHSNNISVLSSAPSSLSPGQKVIWSEIWHFRYQQTGRMTQPKYPFQVRSTTIQCLTWTSYHSQQEKNKNGFSRERKKLYALLCLIIWSTDVTDSSSQQPAPSRIMRNQNIILTMGKLLHKWGCTFPGYKREKNF